MSRFSNLEFDHEPENDLRSEQNRHDSARHLTEAQTAFEQADFEQALRHFGKALESAGNTAQPWAGQVRALIELARYDEASRWVDQALERFPRDPELLAAKAVALARSGDHEGAISFSDASIEEHGNTPYVWLARGDVLLARREKRADYCLEKALGLSSGSWFVAWLAGRIRAFHRQFSLALKCAQQALEWRPDHAMLWVFAAVCQRELGLLGASRTSLQQALQLDPKVDGASQISAGLSAVGFGARVTGWWRRHF